MGYKGRIWSQVFVFVCFATWSIVNSGDAQFSPRQWFWDGALWLVFSGCVWPLGFAYDKMAFLAHHDVVTGVFNRHYAMFVVPRLIRTAHRRDESLSLFIMDGNGLKVLNDTFGHAYGDKAIKDIALALTRILPSDGLVVRMGGDEFLCVVPRVGKGQAMHLVGLLENSVANATRDKDHAISVSAGFAAYPDDGEGFMDLLEIADQRMYTSKSRAYGLTEADDILNMSPELGEFEQLERQKSAHREGDSHQVVPNQDT